MNLVYRPVLFFSAHWGDSGQEIPHSAYEVAPISGMFTYGARRLVRPLYGIRIDRSGNGYIIFDIPQGADLPTRQATVMVFNQAGQISNRYLLSLNAENFVSWQIVDFCPDHQGGVCLLELLETEQRKFLYRIRRCGVHGNTLWEKYGAPNLQTLDFQHLQGKFQTLIVPDRNALFLPARYPQQGIAHFDLTTGEMLSVYQLDELYDRLTMDHAHRVYYNLLLDDTAGSRYVLIRFDLHSRSREVIESEVQDLHNLAGADDNGMIYPRIHDGISRLGVNGQLQWQLSVHGIVVRSEDGHIYIGTNPEIAGDTMTLGLDHYDASGIKMKHLTCPLGEQPLLTKREPPHLVHVSAEPLYYFYAGETEEQGGVMFIFDEAGQIRQSLSLRGSDVEGEEGFADVNRRLVPIESRTGAPTTFEIDSKGAIYIPMNDPEGFKIIRLVPTYEGE